MGKVTIETKEYRSLVEENAMMAERLNQLRRVVDEDSYRMAEQIRLIFGWRKPEKDEEE